MPKNKLSWFSPMQKLVLIVVLVAFLGLCVYLVRGLFLPFFLSFVLAYLLNPLVDKLEYYFKKRLIAVIFLYTVFFSVLGIALLFLIPTLIDQVLSLITNFPSYMQNLQEFVGTLKLKIVEKYPFTANIELVEKIEYYGKKIVMGKAADVPTLIINAVSVISSIFLVPFILFFLLLQGGNIKKRALEFVPNKYFDLTLDLIYKIDSQLGNYLRGLLIEASIVGALSATFLTFLKVDYALIIGAFAGFCNLVPYLGPVGGAIPAIIVIYLKTGSLESIIYVVMAFGLVQFIDNWFIQPIVYSRSIDMHPLVILFAVMLGATYGGIWGMVLAVPIAGIIKVLIFQIYKTIKFRIQISLEET